MSDSEVPEVYEPYSVRERKQARQGLPVELKYDEFPRRLLVQIVQILERTIGTYQRRGGVTSSAPSDYSPSDVWGYINKEVAHEFGDFEIGRGHSPSDRFATHLLSDDLELGDRLNALEIAFRIAAKMPPLRAYVHGKYDIRLTGEQAVSELNRRLREHDMGYQFVGRRIVRSDSEFLYGEVVEPAVALLHYKGFERAEEEFMKAHRHYRNGGMPDALVNVNKALESVLKIALERKGVTLAGNENASDLIPKVTEKILPTHLRTQLQALGKIMETVPSMRNKPGIGHGAGSSEAETLDSIAGYVLNVTAATIVFVVERLVEQEKE